ncbi:uncharacterized protein LOC119095744 [Pollicipes pollicipes]|uniref:uncharacterized protein LOC119095744 n=1 Tax=Pollicipes pollicipes TaxID=41117 RepID=UPI0018851D39|nr:uncharacterized protein LOC119095744 [Pollicipes pollicipes]
MRQVSWVRKRDLKILTVGKFTYTSDHRFTAVHATGSEEWVLKITSPRREDSGVYECQVSVEPKISQPFRLDVVETPSRTSQQCLTLTARGDGAAYVGTSSDAESSSKRKSVGRENTPEQL